MGTMPYSCILFLFLAFLSSVQPHPAPKKIYMVHMKHDSKPHHYSTHHDWYSDTLNSLTYTHDSLMYTYNTAFHGFSAHLHPHQADSLRKHPFVLSVFEDIIYTPHTTRTPDFLGLTSNFAFLDVTKGRPIKNSLFDVEKASSDVIIGVLDTGVWPDSKSFDDEGMPKIPSRWKGKCESGPYNNFTLKRHCNKKLIGARYFHKATGVKYGNVPLTPWDIEGHGTHVATTAAGSPVANASLFGFAKGTARGMAVNARVASYKICWGIYGCPGADILMGIDLAISDGVDIISLSVGFSSVVQYYEDPIAIGAFAAVEKGIFVSCSAGNNGPSSATVGNAAPWITTVGAGTLDRDFPAYVYLGNKEQIKGLSVYSGKNVVSIPVGLVYPQDSNTTTGSNFCYSGSLDPKLTHGKVVVCEGGGTSGAAKGLVVEKAGGVGMILLNPDVYGENLQVESPQFHVISVGIKAADYIRKYAREETNPTALLGTGKTVVNVKPSPMVAAFSSRGPNPVTQHILKPDIIAPGSNILAAWPERLGPNELDTRNTDFNIISGTSMSCPHISGIAALLKAAHPTWSPSAIKSALMTTARTMDNTDTPMKDALTGGFSDPYAYGSGHVDLRKAISPGLIYDIRTSDYMAFVCSLNYTINNVRAIVNHGNVTCSRKFADPGQLNYPSFSVVFENGKRVVRYTRQVTNVGAPRSTYKVEVKAPSPYVEVKVKPMELVFKAVGEKQRYSVTFVSTRDVKEMSGTYTFGSVVWRNPQHQVSSPVAFKWA